MEACDQGGTLPAASLARQDLMLAGREVGRVDARPLVRGRVFAADRQAVDLELHRHDNDVVTRVGGDGQLARQAVPG
jgi:hypothetical protein